MFLKKITDNHSIDISIWSAVIFGSVVILLLFFKEGDIGFPLEDILLAAIALYIAIRTFSSIDQVDKLGKMDGNVLDNEKYVTSIAELINEFKGSDNISLAESLFLSIEKNLKEGSKTASEFADTLQHMIDLIVLFPAVFKKSNSEKDSEEIGYNDRMKKILEQVDNRHNKFLLSVNKGSLIQISEAIKLFKAVDSYQKKISEKEFNVNADLLLVKGPMLKNPVTRTIYHNYLGLVFHKKALNLIKGEVADTLSIEGVTEIFQKNKEGKFDQTIKENVIMYLLYADEEFNKAVVASEEDVMWSGFINFNKARVLFLMNLLSDKGENWLEIMERAIASRSRLNFLIDEILNLKNNDTEENKTYLYKFFAYQEEYARIVKLNFITGMNKKFDDSYTYRGIRFDEMDEQERKKLFEINNVKDFGNVDEYKKILLTVNKQD